MKPRGVFRVKKGKFRSGLPCWRVTGTTLGGKRLREKFETEVR